MNRKLALAGLLALPVVAVAAEPAAEKPDFTGSAELGFLYKTGNTQSLDVKTGFDLRYQKDKWASKLDLDLLIKKAEDADSGDLETTDRKWTLDSKTNYTLGDDKNYMYGNIWYEDDAFGSFDTRSSFSAGWGRHWYKNEVSSFWADIGPGYKRDVVYNETRTATTTNTSWIAQAQALYLRKINEHVEFKQTASAKIATSSGENSSYEAESSITTKLISTLQLKVAFKIEYNTEVAEGKEHTDTQTTATLVYSF